MSRKRWGTFAALLGAALATATPTAAAGTTGGAADATETAASRGRPKIVLDRLELPDGTASHFKRHLRSALKREARRADWGAGRGNTIELRYEVTSLQIRQDGDVLRVQCSAVGRLPRGKSARGNLSFGGDPKRKNQVVNRVLEIVARGVITRLAEMERRRRGVQH